MKQLHRSVLLMSALSASILLSACGGGGAGDTAKSETTNPQALAGSGSDTASAAALVSSASYVAVPSVVTGSGWVSAPLALPSQSIRTTSPMADTTGYAPQFTGTGYYVDRDNGSDDNPGTAAAPWRTLAKASSAPLKAGDALLLKCGSVWRESLEITTAGGRDGDFLIGGYGDCSGNRRPVIRASDWISPTGWVPVDGETRPIYSRPTTTAVTRLFVDGLPQIAARYPNFKGIGSEYALASSMSSRQSFKVRASDLAALASRDLVGATVHIKTTQWLLDTAIIQAFDSSTGVVTLDRQLAFSVREGAGYIIEGKRWMLDSPGEWFYDAGTKELLVWTNDGASPTSHSGIEATRYEHGLVVKWAKNVRVERVRVEQQSVDGILMVETPDATIKDVVSMHAGLLGISALDAPRVTVQGATVVGAGRSGIVLREVPNARVVASKVSDTGGFARADDTDGAIAVFGEGATVTGNLVERSASVGIRFGNRPSTVIEDNTVFNSCLRFTDCGGIYTWTASAPAAPDTAYVARGTVRRNIIVGSRSNQEGCGFSCANLAVGIYLDELSSGVTLSNNIISDAEVGIGLHNAPYNIIEGNTIRNVSFSSVRATQSRSDNAVMKGNRFTSNSLVSSKKMTLTNGVPSDAGYVHAFYFFHGSSPAGLLTTQDNVLSGNTILTTQSGAEAVWGFATWSTYKTLKGSEWSAYAPTDKRVGHVVFRDLVATTEGNLLKNGTFNTGVTDGWTTYFNSAGTGGSFAMGTYTGCGSNCARYVAGHSSDYLNSNTFQMSNVSGQNLYVFRMTAIGGANGGMKRATIRRNVSPWENYGLNIAATPLAPGEVADVEQFFLAGSGDAGVLDLRSAVGGETFFRNVSVSRVTSVTFADPKKLISHVINPSADGLTFPCVALNLNSCDVVDESGVKVTWPLKVAARSSVLLFSRDTAWLGK